MCIALLIGVSALLWTVQSHAGEIPGEWQITGAHAREGGWIVAEEPTAVEVPVPQDGSALVLRIRPGTLEQRAMIRLAGDAGKTLEFTLTAMDAEYRVGIIGDRVIPLPDSRLALTLNLHGEAVERLVRDDYFIRPHPHWYEKEDRERTLEQWDSFQPATTHEARLVVSRRGAHTGLWIDDRYVGGAPLGELAGLRVSLSPGNALTAETTIALPGDANYTPVSLRGYNRPGSLSFISGQPEAGMQDLGGVPFDVAGEQGMIDVGISRWLSEEAGPEEYTDNEYTRSSFDSRPEDILLAIPTDDYAYAHVLCVVDDDPAKNPVLSLRLTRYLVDLYDSGGRGAAIADSSVRLEQRGGRWPEGARQVGTVQVESAGGRRTLPLLQVAVPLKSGHIQDVLEESGIFVRRSTQNLDLELTRELRPIAKINHGNYSIKPVGKPSGVQVLALTLERSPLKVRVRSRQVGHVFYTDERPAFLVEMENPFPHAFNGVLSWRVTDFYGKETAASRAVSVDGGPADRPQTVRIPLEQPVTGWFAAELRLHDDTGRLIWEHPTSFAVLPPDTRRAEFDSPFGVWWFRTHHIGTDDIDEVAPLIRRLGFRKINPSNRGPDGATLARHGLRPSMLTDYVRRGEKGPEMLAEMIAAHPDVKDLMIFHECGFGETMVYPPEFIGRTPPELNETQEQRFQDWWDRAIEYSRYCREKYPDMRFIVGNSSLPFVVEFMRRGYPKDLVDAFGDEDLGQSIMPEYPPGAYKSLYWQREYARLYGYDVPMTSTYEWRGRPTSPGNLTELEQAQLYVRDCLQGLAFELPSINPGLLHDTGDAYYYSRWGCGGYLHRYPLLNPKISYVAVATLTRELDRAVFRRFVPSNSPTLHVMELEHDTGERLYALWLPRGERDVEVRFVDSAPFTLTDMIGNSREIRPAAGVARITVSASPSYIRGGGEMVSLHAGDTRCEPAPDNVRVIEPLAGLDRWEQVRETDELLDKSHFDFPRQAGDITVAAVRDEKVGPCVELTLNPQPEVAWSISRYTTLQAKEPIPVPGEPKSIGMWVKGNSCWGRVFWEFEDAKGATFYSIGAAGGGWSMGDWKGKTFINFDGWNYLKVDLPYRFASGFHGHSNSEWYLRESDGTVAYPIRLTRIVVEMRDTMLHITDPVEVPNRSIRLKNLSAGY